MATTLRVELNLGGAWTDVTSQTRLRDPIVIHRGRADEAGAVDPSTCPLTFNNRGGQFSPRNPSGPYYGLIGRNTPVRVSVARGSVRLTGTGAATTAPDTAALSVTGDLDVRFDGSLPSWSQNRVFLSKYGAVGQISWRIFANLDGSLCLRWSADGTNDLLAVSTVPLPVQSGRQAVRVTIDVDNGAAGRAITFYTARTAAGPWVQLGAPVVQAGTTSIFNSTAVAQVYAYPFWEIYSAEIRNGIGGTLVGNPVFTAQTSGAISFVDAQGNTWTNSAGASITNRRYRFHGEVSNWPSSWDISGSDVYVTVTASGILRRLGQGAGALKSAIQRGTLRSATVAHAYWPMEDAAGSTSMASALPNGPAMAILGAPRLAASDAFPSSNPLPEMAGTIFTGAVNRYVSTNIINVQWLMLIPAGEISAVIARIYTTGTAARWDLTYVAGGAGGLHLDVFDAMGTNILSNALGNEVDDKLVAVYLQLVQDGANIDWGVAVNGYIDPTPGITYISGTLAGRTVGAATSIQINPGQALDTSVIGHLSINAAIPDGPTSLLILRGHNPEAAGNRVQRLCAEEGIAFSGRGDMDDTTAMGVQVPGTLVDLLAEAQAADLGMLLEPRDIFGLGYRARTSIYSQTPTLALHYGNVRDLSPVEDDQGTRNDITVSRAGGSSARAELTTGPLSTQAPPAGVGRYDDSVSVNVASDAMLPDLAAWRLRLGTIDEARFPVIGFVLESTGFRADAALVDAALDLDVGDLLTISNLPAWLPPDQIRQIVQGVTETLGPSTYAIELNCTPASVWGAGTYDDAGAPLSRYDTAGCVTAEALDTTETAIDVTTTVLPVWTQDAADYPFDVLIGGERITVAGCTGTGTAQTFTGCTRSVNGVVKTHLIGATVELADPEYYAL